MFGIVKRLTLVCFLMGMLGAGRAFGQSPSAATLDAHRKEAIVNEICTLLESYYIFPDKGKEMSDRLRKGLKNGIYNQWTDAKDLAWFISQMLSAMSNDKHLSFAFAPDFANDFKIANGQNEQQAKAIQERWLENARRENFGFRRVERLPGNVGYLDLRFFALSKDAGPTAAAALNFLAYCDAVIIDLRYNRGGDPSQVQLICSYFFPEPTHLNDIYNRAEDRTRNFWTLPYVPGEKPEASDLYVLTSSMTFSGAEEFCYDMKNLKRATLIGERTGGAANPIAILIVQNDFVLNVPVGRPINPITKTNWEITGVTPDIPIQAAQAFDKAYTLALERLAAKPSNKERKGEFEWVLAAQRAKMNPPQVAEEVLKNYVGVYDREEVTLENGVLFYQWAGRKYKLAPLGDTVFALEDLDYVRLEFIGINGKTIELDRLYDNGQREKSPRVN